MRWFLAATAALLALLLLTCARDAQAQEPFLPGQAVAQRVAMSAMHPPCEHVGVRPMRPTEATDPGPGRVIGLAYPGKCEVAIDANFFERIATVARRDAELKVCAVLEHEFGHLAGLGDDTGQDLMNSEWALIHPPQECRDAFPAHHRHHRKHRRRRPHRRHH